MWRITKKKGALSERKVETQNSILHKHRAQYGDEDTTHLSQSTLHTLQDRIFLQNCTGKQESNIRIN